MWLCRNEQRLSTVDETVTYAIICFGRGRSDACLILVSNTFAADQSTLPKITGKGIQSLVAKNKGSSLAIKAEACGRVYIIKAVWISLVSHLVPGRSDVFVISTDQLDKRMAPPNQPDVKVAPDRCASATSTRCSSMETTTSFALVITR